MNDATYAALTEPVFIAFVGLLAGVLGTLLLQLLTRSLSDLDARREMRTTWAEQAWELMESYWHQHLEHPEGPTASPDLPIKHRVREERPLIHMHAWFITEMDSIRPIVDTPLQVFKRALPGPGRHGRLESHGETARCPDAHHSLLGQVQPATRLGLARHAPATVVLPDRNADGNCLCAATQARATAGGAGE
jgi:hypothetical protein